MMALSEGLTTMRVLMIFSFSHLCVQLGYLKSAKRCASEMPSYFTAVQVAIKEHSSVNLNCMCILFNFLILTLFCPMLQRKIPSSR